ncbi:MAG: peptidoglycan-binding protein [Candidatus Liptonbacteria bacterium]|nr:peptidoglycan-binding protein [Candidatus Liptonbacteria bacterium]
MCGSTESNGQFVREYLKEGMIGGDVAAAQIFLKGASASPNLTVDAEYGPQMTKAVKVMQRRINKRRGKSGEKIEVDGKIGPKTRLGFSEYWGFNLHELTPELFAATDVVSDVPPPPSPGPAVP